MTMMRLLSAAILAAAVGFGGAAAVGKASAENGAVLLAQSGQLKANTPGARPQGPGSMTAKPSRPLPAVCTSTDGKQTCDCGDKGCVAQNTGCFCFVASDPPGDGSGTGN